MACLLGQAVGDAVGFPCAKGGTFAPGDDWPSEATTYVAIASEKLKRGERPMAAPGAPVDIIEPFGHGATPATLHGFAGASTTATAFSPVSGKDVLPPPRRARQYRFGQVTDDTQLTHCLAHSLLFDFSGAASTRPPSSRGSGGDVVASPQLGPAATSAASGASTNAGAKVARLPVDLDDFSARLCALGQRGAVVLIGHTVRQSISRLIAAGARPGAWESSGGDAPSNGAMMRAVPVAIVAACAADGPTRDEAMAALAAVQAYPTHRGSAAAAASVAFVAALDVVLRRAAAYRGGAEEAACGDELGTVFDSAEAAAHTALGFNMYVDSGVMDAHARDSATIAVTHVIGAIRLARELVGDNNVTPLAAMVRLRALDPKAKSGQKSGLSGDAAVSLAWVLYSFSYAVRRRPRLSHGERKRMDHRDARQYDEDGFVAAVQSAAAAGGDTDTKCSLVGAMAGAYYGALPKLWVDALHDITAEEAPTAGERKAVTITPDTIAALAKRLVAKGRATTLAL